MKYYTHAQVVDLLRKEAARSSQSALAARYKVSRSLVNEIISGRQGISRKFARMLGLRREMVFVEDKD